jgi:polyisoprenoid-binding protein YceI
VTTNRSGRGARVAIAVAVVAILAGAGALIWFLGGEAPNEVEIGSATSQVSGQTEAVAEPEATPTSDAEAAAEAGVASDAAEAVSGAVRIAEELAGIGGTTAVVRTPGVTGRVEVDGTTLVDAVVEADFTALVSNERRRNNAVQRALDTWTHPTARLTLLEPVELEALPSDGGSPVDVIVPGELAVHGVTRAVEVPLEIAVVDGVAVVTGMLEIAFGDYGVQVPTAPVVLSVETPARSSSSSTSRGFHRLPTSASVALLVPLGWSPSVKDVNRPCR